MDEMQFSGKKRRFKSDPWCSCPRWQLPRLARRVRIIVIYCLASVLEASLRALINYAKPNTRLADALSTIHPPPTLSFCIESASHLSSSSSILFPSAPKLNERQYTPLYRWKCEHRVSFRLLWFLIRRNDKSNDTYWFEIFSPSIERNNVHFWELVERIVYHGSVTKMRKSFFTLLLRTSYPTTNTIIFTAIKTIVLYLKIKNRNISITISHFEYY